VTRQITISVSGFKEVLSATLVDNEDAEFADMLWEEVAEPVEMWTVHTISTGDWFSGRGRPAPNVQRSGTQANPLGRAHMMCELKPGSIVYQGHRSVGFGYGPDITEPLPTQGPLVATADDLEAFYRAGRHVCDSHFRTHELVTVTIGRGVQ
jgi:hypothetical protein